MEPLDVARFRGRWVALDPETDRVVGSGTSLAAAEREARERGVASPELYRVPASDAFFVG